MSLFAGPNLDELTQSTNDFVKDLSNSMININNTSFDSDIFCSASDDIRPGTFDSFDLDNLPILPDIDSNTEWQHSWRSWGWPKFNQYIFFVFYPNKYKLPLPALPAFSPANKLIGWSNQLNSSFSTRKDHNTENTLLLSPSSFSHLFSSCLYIHTFLHCFLTSFLTCSNSSLFWVWTCSLLSANSPKPYPPWCLLFAYFFATAPSSIWLNSQHHLLLLLNAPIDVFLWVFFLSLLKCTTILLPPPAERSCESPYSFSLLRLFCSFTFLLPQHLLSAIINLSFTIFCTKTHTPLCIFFYIIFIRYTHTHTSTTPTDTLFRYLTLVVSLLLPRACIFWLFFTTFNVL